ncbi:GspH/FimT family pseudopilin [Thiohalocapsa marina]|uniref:GspH/FimT family pseudopilin n=1 Tax=Thiohalocapsa marina TaxID=424902 RepID=UPI001FE87F79|nr:GspH/FimT family pseudopilin [Thiohalocapsa marina]
MGIACRRRGFTLVELLVVLAIAGLLLAVTPPLITAALPGVELKAAARRTAGGLRLAREAAIASGRDAAWVIDIEDNRYRILSGGSAENHAGDQFSDQSSDQLGDQAAVRSGPPEGRGGRLPAGIDIELVAAAAEMQSDRVGGIRFFPDGTSTGGRVILKRGDSGYQVGVNWLTGRILIAAWQDQ